MVAAAILRHRNISTSDERISTKFGMVAYLSHPDLLFNYNLALLKIQYGGESPSGKLITQKHLH